VRGAMFVKTTMPPRALLVETFYKNPRLYGILIKYFEKKQCHKNR